MTSYFALLGLEARPWLDPGELKERYHAITMAEHPDVAPETGAGRFAEVNRAYQTLADPAQRLRHLMELECTGAATRGQAVPEEIAPLFPQVAETRQGLDVFLKKYAAASGPLAKALLAQEQYAVLDRLETTLIAVQDAQAASLRRLREADALWDEARAEAVAQLPGIWQGLAFTTKWLASMREGLFEFGALQA